MADNDAIGADGRQGPGKLVFLDQGPAADIAL
jgi:hypothetical protein